MGERRRRDRAGYSWKPARRNREPISRCAVWPREQRRRRCGDRPFAGARGRNVTAILFGSIADTKGDARTNFEALARLAQNSSAAKGMVRLIECANDDDCGSSVNDKLSESPDVIVDALFGTGLTRPLQGVHAETVRRVNALRDLANTNPLVVSIDVPSGLNSDSPEPIGEAVQADITVTMTAPKIANVLPPASNYNGRLIVADIGSPAEVHLESTDRFVSHRRGRRANVGSSKRATRRTLTRTLTGTPS